MTHGICNLSLVSVYTEPSYRSGIATQLLFGEAFEVKEQKGEWLRVKLAYDGYEGWMPTACCVDIDKEDYEALGGEETYITYDLVQIALHDKTIVSLVLGSSLPFYRDKKCRVGERQYQFDGNARFPERLGTSRTLMENAYMYLNAPYMWGGRSPFGIDCSGYTQMVFKLSGIRLQRDSHMQAEQGQTVNLLDEANAGDLAFFDNEESRITHVGILAGKDRIIHASGRVRIDAIDHHGIYSKDTNRYSHRLRLIKRLL